MKLIRTSGIYIPETVEDIGYIKTDLLRTVYDINNRPVQMKFYEDVTIDGKKYILIPRYYPTKFDIDIRSNPGVDIKINSKIIPRGESQEKAIDCIVNNNALILELECGRGKTIISIASICKISKKTIICVHKTQLIESWISEFKKHTDIADDKIGKLLSKNYKKALKEFDIILCTPQTFSSILKSNNKDDFLNTLNSSGLGVFFCDECHSGVGPEEFTKMSLHVNCLRTYGLSATPERYDGNTDIIKYHLGETVYFEPDDGELVSPEIYMIYRKYNVFEKHRRYICYGGQYSNVKYIRMLAKCEEYLNDMTSAVLRLYNSNRTILVLGSYIKPLLAIAKKCNLPKSDVGLFMIGKLSKSEILKYSDVTNLQDAFRKKRVIFATYSMARDGVSRDDIDAMIFSTPTSNVIQAAGRCLRKHPNKKTPVILDFVDMNGYMVQSKNSPGKKESISMARSKKRLEIYEKRNWKINHITE